MGATVTSGFQYSHRAAQKVAEDTLRSELARAQQELDLWKGRAKASLVSLGPESTVTAACDQMVRFWDALRRTAADALAKAQRPISTLRLRPEDP